MSSQDYFEQVAGEWDAMRRGFFPDSLAAVVVRAAVVQPGQRVADIGAGTGFLSAAILEAGAQPVAVDESAAMLAQLQARIAGAEIVLSAAVPLALPDDSLDAVVGNMLLHHVEEPAAAIREMARALKAGGRLALSDLDRHDDEQMLAEHHDRWPGFDRAQIVAWFEAAGLREVSVRDASDSEGDCECCSKGMCCTDGQRNIGIWLASGVK